MGTLQLGVVVHPLECGQSHVGDVAAVHSLQDLLHQGNGLEVVLLPEVIPVALSPVIPKEVAHGLFPVLVLVLAGQQAPCGRLIRATGPHCSQRLFWTGRGGWVGLSDSYFISLALYLFVLSVLAILKCLPFKTNSAFASTSLNVLSHLSGKRCETFLNAY